MTRTALIGHTVAVLLVFGVTSCTQTQPEKLTESNLKGSWKMVEIEGVSPPNGIDQFFTFANGKCTFSRVKTYEDGRQPEVRQQVEPCQLNTESDVDRLFLGDKQDQVVTVSIDNGTISLTLTMPDGQKRVTKLVRDSSPEPGQTLKRPAVNEKHASPDVAAKKAD